MRNDFLYIIAVILGFGVICLILCYIGIDDDDIVKQALKEFIIIWMIVISIVYIVYSLTKPTAMDVYQGKTTLEITYKDGVAIDSTVVFK